jgi:transposase
MAQARTLVGLDVHATKIVAATLDAQTGELRSFRLPGCPVEAAKFCSGLPAPVRATYEAGPTGYGLARELAARAVECVVAAPGKIPRAAGDRVKTDPPRRRAPGAAVVGRRAVPGQGAGPGRGGAARPRPRPRGPPRAT